MTGIIFTLMSVVLHSHKKRRAVPVNGDYYNNNRTKQCSGSGPGLTASGSDPPEKNESKKLKYLKFKDNTVLLYYLWLGLFNFLLSLVKR